MRVLPFLLLLLCSLSTFTAEGQDGRLQSVRIRKSQRRELLSLDQSAAKFRLPSVKNTRYKTYLRIWSGNNRQIIDVYSVDGSHYKGNILNYIIQEKTVKRNYEKVQIQSKYFFENIRMDSVSAREIWTHFVDAGLTAAPSIPYQKNDSLICNDCSSVIFETFNHGNYRKANYDYLSMRSITLSYRQAVLDFDSFSKKRLNLDSVFDAFVNKLPKGRIYTDGFWGIALPPKARKLTPARRKKLIEIRRTRIYLDSIESTVDTYLNSFLSKPNLVSDSLSCYFDDYKILIAKDGKLKKVQISKRHKPRLRKLRKIRDYLEERRDVRKCIRVVRAALKPVDLSFLNLQAEIKRTVDFSKEGSGTLKEDYDW